MDRFSERQAEIDERRAKAAALYPALWSNMIAEWKKPHPVDRVWLTYSANYLFRTNNIRWAIDPLTLNWRLKNAPEVDVARDLCNLSFVLLTHGHKDHLDLDLISALRHLPITWIIPEFILSKVIEEAGLPPEKIVVPSARRFIECNQIRILPFDGLHWEKAPEGGLRGVPAMGYMIECNGRRWLFPGDTRTYDFTQLPAFPAIDVVFAHLWLGRGCAVADHPPLLEAFCRFHLEMRARRVILTHLNELGRDADDYWTDSHIELVHKKFGAISADIPVSHLMMGEGAPF